MVKMKWSLVSLVVFLFSCGFACAAQWKIDQPMKFNFTYLPSDSIDRPRALESKPLLTHIPAWEPDISNIGYDGCLAV